ncbi:hypothetical protein RhiirC2_774553 [Rhizophagus irregularis]|uniref:Endonuclease/exonuclease/phosphatase domain-containing protein n=1 Tax=Rhizophagus irregularis TaxID=588596 RepID=A0A2N1NLB8_9GLOM|nr:hypothetical protein RhiirC2_774553 [Rhizophagus irregularis]
MEKAIAKPIASLHNLQFHEYDPSAKKVDKQLRTLVVTDIPLFVTDAQLRGTFSCYVAADLSEIAKEVSAKSINIPSPIILITPSHTPMYTSPLLLPKNQPWGLPVPLNLLALPGMNLLMFPLFVIIAAGRPGCNLDKCASSRVSQRLFCPLSSNDKLQELYNKHLPHFHPAKRHNHFAHSANTERRYYADAAGRHASFRSQSCPRSFHSCSQHNNRHRLQRPSQSELDHDIAAMDIPPLMDWHYITKQITAILEEITHLTAEFAQLQNRVKWLEDQYSSLVTELTKMVQQSIAQQKQFLAALMMDNKKHNFSPHPSPLIKFGQINVNGLCSLIRQQHLLNFFFHSSFGALSLNDTRLFPSNAKFFFKNEHSQHHFRFYWACSISYHPHDGIGILLRNPLHKHSICNDLIAKFLSWLDHAHANNYFVVILGDFNVDEIAHSNYSPNHFKLLHLLSSRFFTDHQAHFSIKGPDPTFYYANGFSPGFPAPGFFSQVVACPNLLDHPFTDHKVLTTVFDFSSYLAILAKSRLKQKKEMHDSLGVYLDRQYNSRLDFSSLSFDRIWHALKAAILSAAVKTLPFHKFLDQFLYRLTIRRFNQPTQISQMTTALPSHLENLVSLLPDYSVSTYSTTSVSAFKSFLRLQKNLISTFLSTKFVQHLTDSIEYYTALRDEHFLNSLGTFINSALSVEKHSIVLDRVLVVLDSTPTLLTDPSNIKQAAITHFQSIVSPPLVRYSSIASFPARWQQAYTPFRCVCFII